MLLISLVTAYAFSRGDFLTGGCLLFVAGVCDTLDGAIARKKGRSSLYVALLDSTLDRYSELCIFFGAVLNPLSPFIPGGPPDIILKGTLIVLAVLSNGTAIRRLLEGKKDLESM